METKKCLFQPAVLNYNAVICDCKWDKNLQGIHAVTPPQVLGCSTHPLLPHGRYEQFS